MEVVSPTSHLPKYSNTPPSRFTMLEVNYHLLTNKSLFEHNVPNCNQFVNHTDGFALQYGNPANTAQVNSQISTIRQHFFKMQGKAVGADLPAVACPGPREDK